MAVNATKAQEWAQRDREAWYSVAYSLIFFWAHQVVPKLFRTNFSLGQFILFGLRILAVFFVAASPIWIDFYEKKELGFKTSALYAALLLGAMIYIWLYETLKNKRAESKSKRRHDKLAALNLSQALKSFSDVAKVIQGPPHEDKKNSLINHLLKCIEHKTRAYLAQYEEGYFQTTLLVFTDSQGESLLIKSRAFPGRRVGQSVEASRCAGSYVAKANRDWKAIHDLKKNKIFPYEGLSEKTEPPYRSVLLIPVILRPDNGNGNGNLCLGVVSIDAARPLRILGCSWIGLNVTAYTVRAVARLATRQPAMRNPGIGGEMVANLRLENPPTDPKMIQENMQDIFGAFIRGEITEQQAVEKLEKLRRKRHGIVERYASLFTEK